MGIETSPADVEESTEPPLRPFPATTTKGTPGLARDHCSSIAASHSSEDKIKITEKNSIASDAKTPVTTTESIEQATEKGTSPAHKDPLDWGEEYKYAHTFSTAQISNVLAVNIQ